MIDEHTRAVAAALARHRPDWPPLTEAELAAIQASVESAPPMTDRQLRTVGRLLRGSKNWPTTRTDRGTAA